MMIEKKSVPAMALSYALLAVVTVLTLLPMIWMLSASLKFDSEVFTVPVEWIPKSWVWSNYKDFWGAIQWPQMGSAVPKIPPFAVFTFNSFKLTLIITLIQVLTSSFAAYGFAKCHFKGRDTLFMLYIATIALPWQVYMLPQYIEIRMLRLIDSHLGYVLLHAFTAFGVFLMRQFYSTIPDELLDASRIDGLNEYGAFFRIILPLSKPVMATLSILTFVSIWNDFMGPMIFLDSLENKTIPLGLRMFIQQYATEYGFMMAASVVSLVPVFVVFLGFQRFFIEGIATSGLKG